MNVEIGAEAALFPEKEYINGIFVAVLIKKTPSCPFHPVLSLTYVLMLLHSRV